MHAGDEQHGRRPRAPSVIEPSAVMSGNAKMRKLMKTPKRQQRQDQPDRERADQQQHDSVSPMPARDRPDPARAADELALAGAGGAAIVVQQVQDAQQRFGSNSASTVSPVDRGPS